MSAGFPWRTSLFFSVAINLLLIGAAVGAYGAGVRVERATPDAVVDRMPGPRAFMAALPEATRHKVREDLAASWVQTRQLREAAVQARRDAFAAAAAEPYDAARVKAAFERMRAADQAVVGVFHNNVADAFGQMSPEERRTALDALRTAVPARRQAASAPADEGAAPAGEGVGPRRMLTPEERQARRERLRERWRERRADQMQQQP
jgi:uncharacterized membrane protein